MSRLESVVGKLEDGELPLEASLAVFEEGVNLSRLGAERLDEAERRVEQLLVNAKGIATEPMAPGESENS